MEEDFSKVVAVFLTSGDSSKVRALAKQWAAAHPIRYAIQDRETTLSRVVEQDLGLSWTVGQAVAEITTTADDIYREIQIYSDHLFRQARWEAELLKLDFHGDQVLPMAERAVRSSERAVDTLDSVAPSLKDAVETLNSIAPSIKNAAETASHFPELLISERKTAIDAVYQDLAQTLIFLHGERIASMRQISDERTAVLVRLTDERIAALKELREIAVEQRLAFSKDMEQAGFRLVDHAVWRITQLITAILAFLFLTAILFLFLIRRLFFPAASAPRLGSRRLA